MKGGIYVAFRYRTAMPPREASREAARRAGRRPLRRVVESAVLLAIVGIMASEFLVEGWLAPIVVSSGSMATTILGPHRQARCPECGMEFVVDAVDAGQTTGDAASAQPGTPLMAVCPNCGHRGIKLDQTIIGGDRLIVNRSAFLLRQPRRWELALFRCPEVPSDYCVKRIVGLPGETVEIRDGEVFIDAEIARKSLAIQRDMAVLVHDTAWTTADVNLPNRWSPSSAASWTQTGAGWQILGSSQAADAPAWLDYVHWRRLPGQAEVRESPILDEDGYNQTVSRQLNRTSDLMLVCQLSAAGTGTLLVKVQAAPQPFQIAIAPAKGRVSLLQAGKEVRTARMNATELADPVEIVVSTFGRQIVLAINDREIIEFPFGTNGDSTQTTSTPFSIGANNLDVRISRLQIWRDIYYTPPRRALGSTVRQLGADEYFVLGDNSPISRDSRSWTGGGPVSASLLIGPPLAIIRH